MEQTPRLHALPAQPVWTADMPTDRHRAAGPGGLFTPTDSRWAASLFILGACPLRGGAALMFSEPSQPLYRTYRLAYKSVYFSLFFWMQYNVLLSYQCTKQSKPLHLLSPVDDIIDRQIEEGLIGPELREKISFVLLRKHKHQTKKPIHRSLADLGKSGSGGGSECLISKTVPVSHPSLLILCTTGWKWRNT